MHKFILSLLLMTACLSLLAPHARAVSSQSGETMCHYKIGVVPQFEQRQIYKVWRALLDEMENKTGCHFELIGSKTIADFETAFKEGAYDLAYMNPYHAVIAWKSQGYIPIIRSGAQKMKGILVVRKDSAIENIEGLKGAQVVFPSPNALGASLLMRAELARKHNIYVEEKYVKTHSSVYLHVAKGLAVAGGGVMRSFEKQPDHIKDSLHIIHMTKPVNAHPLVIHPRVAETHKKKIKHSWLALSAEAPELFEGIPMKHPVQTSYKDYALLDALGLERFAQNE